MLLWEQFFMLIVIILSDYTFPFLFWYNDRMHIHSSHHHIHIYHYYQHHYFHIGFSMLSWVGKIISYTPSQHFLHYFDISLLKFSSLSSAVIISSLLHLQLGSSTIISWNFFTLAQLRQQWSRVYWSSIKQCKFMA